MKNYNDITILTLEYFLAEKPTLEWLLSGVTGVPVKLAMLPEAAMPWEDITSTPDIRAVSEDSKAYQVLIERYGLGDRMTELRRLAEKEPSEMKEVHVLLFLGSQRDEEGVDLPAYQLLQEGRFHYHIMSLSGNPAASPLAQDIQKFLDFLGGRDEKLWKKEPFRTLLKQSGYQSCWADIFRWRRKKAFFKAYTRALAEGYNELTARSRAEAGAEDSADALIKNIVEGVNTISRETQKDWTPEDLAIILEVPAHTIAAIRLGGYIYTEDDMKNFYLEQYRRQTQGFEGRG